MNPASIKAARAPNRNGHIEKDVVSDYPDKEERKARPNGFPVDSSRLFVVLQCCRHS